VWVVGRRVPWEEQSAFLGLVCSGWSVIGAAEAVGVARSAARRWWRRWGVMTPAIQSGRRGGLPGSVAAAVPGAAGWCACGTKPDRGRRPLTSEDRAVIAVGLRMGCSLAQIGRMTGRNRSVIKCEVDRNRSADGSYWAPVAHRRAHERRRRPKPTKLSRHPGLRRYIEDRMDEGWSPKLIAQVLHQDASPGKESWMGHQTISHETIYQALYVQGRGELRKDLYRQLSLKRGQRKPRGHRDGRGRSIYAAAYTIRDRPPEAVDRAVPGHWEGDLIVGAGCGSAIGTLVERSTRFTILLHLPDGHDAGSVAAAMIRQMSTLPEHLRRSITWDRGSELADYQRIQVELGTTVYFCDPHSPWQRGTNENTNRLLRFWFEKGTDLSGYTQSDLDRVAATLNRRPRPTLDLQTPAQRLAQLLTDTAAA
jgi:transposase, IS30 family